MKEYDEEHIEFLWRVRNNLAKEQSAYKWRQVLWTEIARININININIL